MADDGGVLLGDVIDRVSAAVADGSVTPRAGELLIGWAALQLHADLDQPRSTWYRRRAALIAAGVNGQAFDAAVRGASRARARARLEVVRAA
jgi:hypothetical protein